MEPDFDGSAVPGKVFQAPLVVSADCSARRRRALAVIEQKFDIAFAPACMASLRLAVGMRRYTAHVAASRGVKTMQSAPKQPPFPLPAGRRARPGAGRGTLGEAHRCDLARDASDHHQTNEGAARRGASYVGSRSYLAAALISAS